MAIQDPGRPPTPDSSGRDAARESWEEAVRRISRREHALTTLMELSRSFTASSDLYYQIDALLLGAMGQLGTARGALWVISDDLGTMPILLRSHGFRRSLLLGFGSLLSPALIQTMSKSEGCMTASEFSAHLDESGRLLTVESGVAVVALIPSAMGALGVVTIGAPLDRERYDAGDLQLLETAVGLIGMALVNSRLNGELAESNRLLRQNNESMQELDRIKSEFISNVNHELRTPLSIIRASLELLQDKTPSDGDSRRMVDMAMNASHRLQGLVENLLMFSDLRQDSAAGQTALVNVPKLLAEFHQTRLPGINAGYRDFVLACDDELPPAQADPKSLLRILEELVNNALKFTPRGTRVEIGASHRSSNEGDFIVISVRDDGPGVPTASRTTLFREFEHGGASQSACPGGIGLGLALARELTQRMGGVLEATAPPGGGACFEIRLRVGERRHAQEPGTEARAA